MNFKRLKNERWKPIADSPGYAVSTHGRVASKWQRGRYSKGKKGEWRLLTPSTHEEGYKYVPLPVRGKRRSRLIQCLVLEAFIGPRPKDMEACHHPDPTPSNNKLENLRWDTRAENEQDKKRVSIIVSVSKPKESREKITVRVKVEYSDKTPELVISRLAEAVAHEVNKSLRGHARRVRVNEGKVRYSGALFFLTQLDR